jgi:hypothetical protein
MAILIEANGDVTPFYPINTLESLQKGVGGYIEIIYTKISVIIVNEEGLIHELPFNELGTNFAGQPIVGNVIVCTKDEWKKKQ